MSPKRTSTFAQPAGQPPLTVERFERHASGYWVATVTAGEQSDTVHNRAGSWVVDRGIDPATGLAVLKEPLPPVKFLLSAHLAKLLEAQAAEAKAQQAADAKAAKDKPAPIAA
jgi:hypothetical protein